jgi:putative transposase
MNSPVLDHHKQDVPVVVMGQGLAVSARGLSAWRKRPPCRRTRQEAQLPHAIGQVGVAHQQRYGSPRLHAELKDQRLHASRKRLAHLMPEADRRAKGKRRRGVITNSRPPTPIAPTRWERACTPSAPNNTWGRAIPSVPPAQGWLSLAVVVAVFPPGGGLVKVSLLC